MVDSFYHNEMYLSLVELLVKPSVNIIAVEKQG